MNGQVVHVGVHRGVNFNYGHGSFVDFSNNKLEARKLTAAILAEWLERFMDRLWWTKRRFICTAARSSAWIDV